MATTLKKCNVVVTLNLLSSIKSSIIKVEENKVIVLICIKEW
jgi:hypothetical protein